MERYRAADTDYERRVSVARKAAAGAFDELDGPRIAWLTEAFKAAILTEDGSRRVSGTSDAEMHQAADDGYRETLARGDTSQIRQMFEKEGVALAAEQGWHFDTTTEAFAALSWELLKVAVDANEIRIARDNGQVVQTPRAPEVSTNTSTIPPHRSGRASRSFVQQARQALDRPALGISATTKQATNTALKLFREVHGDLSPEVITPVHVTRLIDLLAHCPARRPKTHRSWPLPKLAAEYEGKDVQRLTGKTISQHIGMLSAIWRKLRKAGDIDRSAQNPFSDHDIPKVRRKENAGLTISEMEAMFALPVFTAGDRPSGGKGEACYWVPLLLLWTGARPEEIAQLLVEDIYQHSDTGEWVLRISDEGLHPHKGARTLKTSRTGTGERRFPVPHPLIDLGLIRYVEWLKASDQTAMFPALRTKGQRRELFAGFGGWWSGYVRQHGALAPGRRAAREFRHTWNTAARRNRISEEAREYIMGHSIAHRSQNAGYGERAALGEEIHRVTFDKLDLTRVLPWDTPSQ